MIDLTNNSRDTFARNIVFLAVIYTSLFVLLTLTLPVASASDTVSPNILGNINNFDDDTAKLSGTAWDSSNDANVSAGISRVEVKIDQRSWVTATGTTSFNYTATDLEAGYHVAGFRAFDYSNNPSEILYLGFTQPEYDDTSDSEDISWYVSLEDVHIETTSDVMNIKTVELDKDVKVVFDIENDDTVSHKFRWEISNNVLDFDDDVLVKAGRSSEVEQWISGVYFQLGTNRVTIDLIDWDTRDVIDSKDLTFEVVLASEDTTYTTSDPEEMPAYLVEFAELNGLKVSSDPGIADVDALQEDINTLTDSVTDLQVAVSELKSDDNEQPEEEVVYKKADDDEEEDEEDEEPWYIRFWGIWVVVGLGVAYHKRYDWGIVKDKDDDGDYPQHPPSPYPPMGPSDLSMDIPVMNDDLRD
ncbi:hypothetical protein [Methanolobus sp. WCC4]|uniref:hypothetical protein n=1 Tax=Methanolobus sp. WCC4 TaxID=3125784 RepID=UPI0030F97111